MEVDTSDQTICPLGEKCWTPERLGEALNEIKAHYKVAIAAIDANACEYERLQEKLENKKRKIREYRAENERLLKKIKHAEEVNKKTDKALAKSVVLNSLWHEIRLARDNYSK